MGIIPFDTLIPIVRYHVYEVTVVDGYDIVDASYLAGAIDADVTSGYVKMAFKQLENQSDIEFETTKNPITGAVKTGNVSITAKGIKAVEKDLGNRESIVSLYQDNGFDGIELPFVAIGIAPAADRIVLFSDNEPAATEARHAVEKLHEKVVQANDLPESLNDYRDVVIGEIEALQSLINQAAVRASIVITLARKLLPWLADKAGSAAIGELAKRALALLINWLT